jgi:4'-phosphopantetheinyl transferase
MTPVWNAPSAYLLLSKKDVHLWRADLALAERSIQKLNQTLSIDERERAGRFHFEQDRRYFIVRRGILRTILGYYLNVEPGRLQFQYGKNGKPALADTFGNGTISFNISRSERLALFVFTRDREIGVDIEYMRDISEMEQIVERFFSVKENEVFRSLPKSQKREAFLNGWTCKEAFIKALGGGLSQSLDEFDVSLVPGEPARLLRISGDPKEASRWSLRTLRPAPNYVGTFAVKSHMFETKRWRWELT